MSFNVTELSFPGFVANCYLVVDEESKEAFLVDPGAYGSRQCEYIKSQGVKLRYILLTHGHYDHILGVRQFRDEFSAEVVIHTEDEECLRSALKSLSIMNGAKAPGIEADITVSEGDSLPFGEGEIKVMHIPGHTRGSVCYLLSDMIFSGDTLFKCGVGRTDFPGGSQKQLLASLGRLSSLEGDYTVYPGHESATTLDYERRYNSCMRGN